MQLGGFREQIQKGKFHVIVGNNKEKELSEETIYANSDEELTENTTLHIMPVIRGAKRLGFCR
ncbi:tail assembly protein [Haemophilus influenzae]